MVPCFGSPDVIGQKLSEVVTTGSECCSRRTAGDLSLGTAALGHRAHSWLTNFWLTNFLKPFFDLLHHLFIYLEKVIIFWITADKSDVWYSSRSLNISLLPGSHQRHDLKYFLLQCPSIVYASIVYEQRKHDFIFWNYNFHFHRRLWRIRPRSSEHFRIQYRWTQGSSFPNKNVSRC